MSPLDWKSLVKNNRHLLLASVVVNLGVILVILFLAYSYVTADREALAGWFRNLGLVTATSPTSAIGPFPYGGDEAESQVVKIVSASNPAVVSIIIAKNVSLNEEDSSSSNPLEDFFGESPPSPRFQEREVGGGSGFIVSPSGLVVTNYHVISDDKATYYVVNNDGRRYRAEIVAEDSSLDIALLRIRGSNFSYLTFGDSEQLRSGQTVIAIGNALGEFRNSVSVGVVSGLSRSVIAGDALGRTELLEGVVQTDAAINPGNSGGPLLDLDGRVVGMNVAIARGSENIGFAIPSNVVKKVVDSVQKRGFIERPFLGIRYLQVTSDLKNRYNLQYDYGVIVTPGENTTEPAVIANSPAARAGLRAGDVVLEINGEKLTNDKKSFASLLREKKVGDTVTLKVWRKDKTFDVSLKLVQYTE